MIALSTVSVCIGSQSPDFGHQGRSGMQKMSGMPEAMEHRGLGCSGSAISEPVLGMMQLGRSAA